MKRKRHSYLIIDKMLFVAIVCLTICALAGILILYANQKLALAETLQVSIALVSLLISIITLGISIFSLFYRRRRGYLNKRIQ